MKRKIQAVATQQPTQRPDMPKKDLPPGLTNTVWKTQEQSPKYPKLQENVTADVAIVGAGIYGLSIAYNLVRAGKSVVILESRTRGGGQTGRTTAHLMAWNDDMYHTLEEKFGTDKTKLVAESHRKSIDWVEEVVKREQIDCKFERMDGFLFPHSEERATYETLDEELGAAIRAGLTDTEKVDLGGGPDVGGIRSAVKFAGSADFQPMQYVNGLAEAVTKMGGRIYENSRVMKTSGSEVTTADGYTITAKNIVLATNVPIHHNMAVHTRQHPTRSYVVCMKIPKDKFRRAQYWSTASPYHYVRLEPSEEGDQLVVGGGDHQTGQEPEKYEDTFSALEQWARKRWPDAGEVTYKWSGQVMEPVDLLGLYGQDPANDLQTGATYYIATGDSGQGMTGSAIAGMIISDQILGNKNPWSDIYSPSRAPAADTDTVQEFGSIAATTSKAFVKHIIPKGLFSSPRDLPPDSGAVMQHGAQKIAAYRDEGGKVHACAAACPHLGCLVEWNPNEKTFDCPCHGSHFDKFGRCIQGPAKADLSPVDYEW
ncbi:hypothetical protein WJX72_001432 [[Myrmecia] bisecta]|uniref:Rieske domain-containing protein n=1 Tax=[Myrmecia] bisecta TaxID=41462 RepID=A0AAW1P4B5_9CHLO